MDPEITQREKRLSAILGEPFNSFGHTAGQRKTLPEIIELLSDVLIAKSDELDALRGSSPAAAAPRLATAPANIFSQSSTPAVAAPVVIQTANPTTPGKTITDQCLADRELSHPSLNTTPTPQPIQWDAAPPAPRPPTLTERCIRHNELIAQKTEAYKINMEVKRLNEEARKQESDANRLMAEAKKKKNEATKKSVG